MPELCLHIGHGKTGSSYIQSCLANSHATLAAHGIDYHGGAGGPAADWNISSGNGVELIRNIDGEFEFPLPKVLFSAEHFFRALCLDAGFRGALPRFCTRHGITAVRMLLFIRDPVRHAESEYQQSVKRGGASGGPESEFARHMEPEWVRQLLETKLGLPDCRIDLFNYDRHANDLIDIVNAWLDLPPGTIAERPGRQVNRSMTAGELRLLRTLNAGTAIGSGFLADALCNRLPDRPADRCLPPLAVQQHMLDRLGPAIAAVNARLPEGERYSCATVEPAPADTAQRLDNAQIDVVGAAMAEQLARLEAQSALHATRASLFGAELRLGRGQRDKAREMLEQAERHLGRLDRHQADLETVVRLERRLARLRDKTAKLPR